MRLFLILMIILTVDASGKSPIFTSQSIPAAADLRMCDGTKYYTLSPISDSSNLVLDTNTPVLDIKDGLLVNGATLQLWTWVGGANQIWFIQQGTTVKVNGYDTFLIRTLLNGKCLTATTPVLTVSDCNDNYAQQRWYSTIQSSAVGFTPNSYGKLYNNNMCLNANGTYANGLLLTLSDCLNSIDLWPSLVVGHGSY